jgi:hypothetical protein
MTEIMHIGVVFVAHYRVFIPKLAALMKAENPNLQIFLYVSNNSQKELVEKNYDQTLFADVILAPRFADDFDDFIDLSEESKIAEIEKFEKEYECSANSLLVVDRHFGRGYSPAGFFHARSSKIKKYGLLDALYSHVRVLNFFKNEIATKNITLFIGGSSLVVKACEFNKIPYRNLVAARFENRYSWCVDQYWSNPLIKKEYDKIADGGVSEVSDLQRYHESKKFRAKNLAAQDTLLWLMKTLTLITARYIKHSYKRHAKAPGRYMLSEQIMFAIRRYIGRKYLTKPKLAMPLCQAPAEFIFYPLQTEPEATLQAFSPEFFFQHTLIIMLAKSSNFGLPILVKETLFAAGRRPENFYDQILDLLNVSFLDLNEEGIDVIKRASIVCTISGTAGIEAALLGKPILNFGQHNCYEFLDHSIQVSSFGGLEKCIQRALAVNPKNAKRDGLKFQQALKAATFDMKDYSSISPEKVSDAVVEAGLLMLKRSLKL